MFIKVKVDNGNIMLVNINQIIKIEEGYENSYILCKDQTHITVRVPMSELEEKIQKALTN